MSVTFKKEFYIFIVIYPISYCNLLNGDCTMACGVLMRWIIWRGKVRELIKFPSHLWRGLVE